MQYCLLSQYKHLMYIAAGVVKNTFRRRSRLKIVFQFFASPETSHLSSKASFAAWIGLHLSFDLKCVLLVADIQPAQIRIRAFYDVECLATPFP